MAKVPVSRAAGAPFVQRKQRGRVLEENVLEAYERILHDGLASRATLQRSEGISCDRQAFRQRGHRVAGRGLIQAKQRLEWPHGRCLEPTDGILPADLGQPPRAAGRVLLHIVAATSKKAARERGGEEYDAPSRSCCTGGHSTDLHAYARSALALGRSLAQGQKKDVQLRLDSP